jgi:hypothetical protein
VRPWGELTFSQSKSAPCAKKKCNGTLSAALQREPLQLKGGVFNCVEGCGKFLQAVLRNLCLFLRPQPDEQS